jgi:hypothetical protein
MLMKNEKEFNPSNYVYFVLLGDKIDMASYGFTGYTDADGEYNFMPSMKDPKTGDYIPKKYRFTRSRRTLRVSSNNKKELEFLRNHPECKGSKNGSYVEREKGKLTQVSVFFKELNDGKDAEVSINATEIRLSAMNKALELQKDKVALEDVAICLSFFSKDPKVLLHQLLQYAENEPEKFLQIYDAEDIKQRALFLKGKNGGVIQRKGSYYVIENEKLGVDEDECVMTIIKNPGYEQLIEKGLGIDSHPETKKLGRPKKED